MHIIQIPAGIRKTTTLVELITIRFGLMKADCSQAETEIATGIRLTSQDHAGYRTWKVELVPHIEWLHDSPNLIYRRIIQGLFDG